ncbi:chemotaxis response regulator protein-glutamate methylesterase [soil metagenome]
MKIGIVNDSFLAQQALRSTLEEGGDVEIVWTAEDGLSAVEKCRELLPDMILMDILMPRMGGVEATRRIMAETPCPILVVTASMEKNVGAVFEAMGAGAIDAVATPPLHSTEGRRLLMEKIRSVAAVSDVVMAKKEQPLNSREIKRPATQAVLLGSSAGGPAALLAVLSKLPKLLPAAVVIIQHIDAQFSSDLASWLGAQCALPVRLAAEDDELSTGEVLIAQGGRHLVFRKGGLLHYTDQPKLSYQPSVDVFYDSAVKFGPRSLLGVILTGMGRDGAVGLKQLRTAGHTTIAQDQATSAIYGMPRAAAQMNAAMEILPLNEISRRIATWSGI